MLPYPLSLQWSNDCTRVFDTHYGKVCASDDKRTGDQVFIRSVLLPLSDSSLVGRVMHASIRSLPEPLRNEGFFGSRSLVPPRRSAAA